MRPAVRLIFRISGALAVCVAAGASAAAAEDEIAFPLTPVLTTDPSIEQPSTWASVRPQPWEPLRAEPEYISLSPQYGRFYLGSEARVYDCVVDESRGSGMGYDRICVDTDGDKDLSDENWVTAKEIKDGQAILPLLGLTVRHRDGGYTYHIAPSLSETHGAARIRPAYHMEGRVTFGTRDYLVALIDDNCNCAYNDHFSLLSEAPVQVGGDMLVIDLDGDGKLSKRAPMTREAYPFGAYLYVDRALYRVQAPDTGRELRVMPYRGTTGRINVKTSRDFVLDLLGPRGVLRLTQDTRDVEAPTGTYIVYCAGFEGQTADGFTWRAISWGNVGWKVPVTTGIEARLNLTNLPAGAMKLEIEGVHRGATWTLRSREIRSRRLTHELIGEATKPTFGPPVQILVHGERASEGVRFTMDLKGCAGTLYSLRDSLRNGEALDPPKIVVRNSAGHVVHRGAFRYG